ncbi:MAG: hypothetical protein MJ247_07435 [Alphaproteobacteria bacterium]|nr:hypothetical protein [Alphaproteobacteria bacterium]
MPIKVKSSSSVSTVGSSSKSSGVSATDASDFASLLSDLGSTSATSTVVSSAPVDGIEALLAAQFVGDAMEGEARRKKAIDRGNNLLDQLNDLRNALLVGRIPKQKLIAMSQALRERKDTQLEPELAEIINDIEIRVSVELAKLNLI